MIECSKKNWKSVFSVIYAGQAFSLLSSSIVQFAVIWWLTVKTESSIMLTLASLVTYLPAAIVGPFSGVWIDRFDRKKVMIIADGFVSVSSVALAVAFLFGDPPVWFVFVILGFRAFGGTFHSPAIQAAVPMFVPQDRLVQAGGWSQMINSASNILGYVLGAAFYRLMNMEWIIMLDVFGAVIAIAALCLIKFPQIKPPSEKIHVLADMKQGVQTLTGNRGLMAVCIPVLLACIVFLPLIPLMPLFIKVRFHGTEWHNAIGQFLLAAGMMATSFVLGMIRSPQNQNRMITISLMAVGVLIFAGSMLSDAWYPLACVLFFLIGCSGALFYVPFMAELQKKIPPESLGKVMSFAYSAMSWISMAGLLIAGPVSEFIGINHWFTISGALLFFVGILCLLTTHRYSHNFENK